MLSSLMHNPAITYPSSRYNFSPSESYPEYPFDDISSEQNNIYKSVRDCFIQAGLDEENIGKNNWNPLKNYVNKRDSVFVLCNFVYHRRQQETIDQFFAKCTHASILRAVIDYIYIATGRDGVIAFGNAPLQSCNWDKVLADTGALTLLDFYKKVSLNVEAKDLRLFIAERSIAGNTLSVDRKPDDEGVLVSLGENSFLNHLYLSNQPLRFRVSDYNPDRIEKFHDLDRHDYVINRTILESDVIFSVPKLKTHEKVGITVGLKGFVGCVGHKDCLAHHRFGSPNMKGDEYPNNGNLQVLMSKFHDYVYRRNYPRLLQNTFEILDRASRHIARRYFNKIQGGAWFGNDTAWRMTLDLARIVFYAARNGKLVNQTQRRHIMLIDGVTSGEGNGPLAPIPVHSHLIAFVDNIVFGDLLACRLMGFNYKRLPLIDVAIRDQELSFFDHEPVYCVYNGQSIEHSEIESILERPFATPQGWQGYL